MAASAGTMIGTSPSRLYTRYHEAVDRMKPVSRAVPKVEMRRARPNVKAIPIRLKMMVMSLYVKYPCWPKMATSGAAT